MANTNVSASKDESLAMARKVTQVLESVVEQYKSFLKQADDCEGISGLSEFRDAVATISVELTKLVDTAGSCEKTIKQWWDKLDEADNILKNTSLTGGN